LHVKESLQYRAGTLALHHSSSALDHIQCVWLSSYSHIEWLRAVLWCLCIHDHLNKTTRIRRRRTRWHTSSRESHLCASFSDVIFHSKRIQTPQCYRQRNLVRYRDQIMASEGLLNSLVSGTHSHHSPYITQIGFRSLFLYEATRRGVGKWRTSDALWCHTASLSVSALRDKPEAAFTPDVRKPQKRPLALFTFSKEAQYCKRMNVFHPPKACSIGTLRIHHGAVLQKDEYSRS
jgi:hypothetical protein